MEPKETMSYFDVNNTARTHTENQIPHSRKDFRLDALLLILLAAAIFFPSSVNSDFGKLTLESFAFLIVTLLLLGYRFFSISLISLIGLNAIAICHVFFTLNSEFSEFAFGHVFSAVPILLLAALKIKRFPSLRLVLRTYYLTVFSIFFLAYAGFLMPSADTFIVNFYAGGYEGLAEKFQENQIPVSIFISHSYAGFFYFLILLTSSYLITHEISRYVNCVIICICLGSMLALKSGSSYFFLFYSAAMLAVVTLNSRRTTYLSLSLKASLFPLAIFTTLYVGSEFIPSLMDRIIGDSGNGLLSRYGTGVLASNIEYISKNPLIGIGLAYSPDLYYTDSDYITTTLRLGLVGASLYFLYLFLFLYRSLIKPAGPLYFTFLLFAFAAFMISMPISTFYRTTPFLLLVILLFWSVQAAKQRAIKPTIERVKPFDRVTCPDISGPRGAL